MLNCPCVIELFHDDFPENGSELRANCYSLVYIYLLQMTFIVLAVLLSLRHYNKRFLFCCFYKIDTKDNGQSVSMKIPYHLGL
jgi:hypothetical protein